MTTIQVVAVGQLSVPTDPPTHVYADTFSEAHAALDAALDHVRAGQPAVEVWRVERGVPPVWLGRFLPGPLGGVVRDPTATVPAAPGMLARAATATWSGLKAAARWLVS